MKRLFPTIFFICLFAASFSAQTVSPTATPTPKPTDNDDDVVKISTTLIQVDVTVTDSKGKIITDLKPEEFEIYENNQKQDITNFSFVSVAPEISATPAPSATPKNNAKNSMPLPPPAAIKPEQVRRTVALVVDDLTLSFESTHYVREALKKFVNTQMQDGDLVAIIRTGGGIGALQQFTSDRRQLFAAIEKIRWNLTGSGKIGAFAPIEATALEQAKSMGMEVSDEQLEAERNRNQNINDFQGSVFATGTLGALNYIIRGMQELPGRKSVMLMSDGFKLITKDESGFSETSTRIMNSLNRLIEQANRASVVVYTMDARGLQTLGLEAKDDVSGLSADQIGQRLSDRRNELFDTQDGLIYLARQTGGIPLINNNDLSGGIRKMLEDQKGYYLLGYAPDAETFDPKTRRFNKLTVKIKRPGLKVRYRSGFFGVADEDVRPVLQTPSQQLNNALISPFAASGINLRLNALFGNDIKVGTYIRSLLHVDAKDLKFTDEPDGSHKATFNVLAISFGDNGVVVDQLSKIYTVTVRGEAYQRMLTDGFVYNFVFPVKKAGAYQLRIALRDAATEKVGSANQFIEVPNLKKGALTVSGIILDNLTEKQFQDSLSNTKQPENPDETGTTAQTDTSLRRFKRGTVLRYGFEIYNAKVVKAQNPQLTTQTRIFKDGKLLFEGKPTQLDIGAQTNLQKIGAERALNLGREMTPGDYVLQVIVIDNLAKEKRKIATQFVQFEIIE